MLGIVGIMIPSSLRPREDKSRLCDMSTGRPNFYPITLQGT